MIRKSVPALNKLGKRIISGQDALTESAPKELIDYSIKAVLPAQSSNFWSVRSVPPDEELIQRLEELTNLNQILVDRDDQIKKLNHILADRDEQIKKLNHVLTDRDDQIKKLNHVLTDRDDQINKLNKALTDRDSQIVSLNQAVTERNSQITYLLNSNSLRVTKPLRWIRRQIYLCMHVFRLVRQYVNQRGGIINGTTKMFSRAVEVFRCGGLGGFVAQLRAYSHASAQWNLSKSPIIPSVIEKSSQKGQQIISNDSVEDVAPVDYRFWQHFLLKTEVDIIVCVHNALDDAKRCLSSVIRYSPAICRLIIVDDGSRKDTQAYLQSFCNSQNATLLRNDVALGYTFAANQGLRESIGGYAVLLNSDTIVTPGWIEKLVVCAESSSSIGIVGPLSNTASWQSVPEIEDNGDWATNPLPDGISVSQMSGLIAKYSSHVYPRMSFLNGFCLMIRREVIDQIGIFDEVAFGRGYGEENDYCLRARKAGWELALADNAYVFHAQSKSYSHEKRKVLADRANLKLAEKHGHAIINSGVEQCRLDRVLTSNRAHAKIMFEREALIKDARTRWEGRRLLFVLPVMYAGGGANVVITELRAMARMGVDVSFVNLSVHRKTFEQSFPNLDVSIIYVDSPDEITVIASNFDAVIATANHSVQWLQPIVNLPESPVLGYYIQDFEPYFFAEGTTEYQKALESYTLIPGMKLFTKTEWNQREVSSHIGLLPTLVGPSYDVDLFRPWKQDSIQRQCHPIRVVAMVRPSSPRRNPEGTMHLLEMLMSRFADRIEISIFGAEKDGPSMPHCEYSNEITNYGQLRPSQIASLFSGTDIFIDMSHFQAMGLTAMEAMGCGAVAVVPIAGGANSFARHYENALVVNTESVQEVFDTLCELIDDHERLHKLRLEALSQVVQHHPERSAHAILQCLLG
nr:glycosyltransferase [Methylomarinum sp. Ch1-1]MDP4522852.1 glycosyltransferase [Methylomarinum sp. Ch1-1]